MKKMAFLVAALALSFGSTAFAEEKTQGTDVCCRTGDDGCTEPYTGSCEGDGRSGHFCSTAKDAQGNKLDYRVVWTVTCSADETCNNADGNISCAKNGAPTGSCTSSDTPSCATDKSEGYYCNTQTSQWGKRTCNPGTECIIRGTSVICEEPGGPTVDQCDKDTAQATCSSTGKTGWYCSNNGHWTSKTCDNADCTATGNSVKCGGGTTDPEMPTGTCDPETVQGQCNAAHTVGYYCKNDGTWTRKTCESCSVNTARPNSVSCGGGGGEQGNDCSAGEVACTSASEGWYCNNGNKKPYTCETGTCGIKNYNNKNSVTCCSQGSDGNWYDVKYSDTACTSVYDSGSNPPAGGCDKANYCSDDKLIAYNCDGSTLKPTPCLDGKTCELKNGTATCVGSINNTGNKDKKDEDGGCSATGAGLALGWLGLALIPAIRRRSRK